MEISEIKRSLNIETVLNHYGLKPNRHHQINCPFPASDKSTAGRHEDKTPNLKIYPKTNTFNCFG